MGHGVARTGGNLELFCQDLKVHIVAVGVGMGEKGRQSKGTGCKRWDSTAEVTLRVETAVRIHVLMPTSPQSIQVFAFCFVF